MPGTNKEYGREQVLEIANSVVHKVEESQWLAKKSAKSFARFKHNQRRASALI